MAQPKAKTTDREKVIERNIAILELFEKAGGSTPEEVPIEKVEAIAVKYGEEISDRDIGRLRWMYKVRTDLLKTPTGKEIFRAFVKAGNPRGVKDEELVAIAKKHGQKFDEAVTYKHRWALSMRVNRDLFPPEKTEKPAPKAEKMMKKVKAAAKAEKPAPKAKAPAPKTKTKTKTKKAAKAEAGNGADAGASNIDQLISEIGAIDQV